MIRLVGSSAKNGARKKKKCAARGSFRRAFFNFFASRLLRCAQLSERLEEAIPTLKHDCFNLLESTPLIKFMQNYIRDSSSVFFHILTGKDIDDFTDIKFVS